MPTASRAGTSPWVPHRPGRRPPTPAWQARPPAGTRPRRSNLAVSGAADPPLQRPTVTDRRGRQPPRRSPADGHPAPGGRDRRQPGLSPHTADTGGPGPAHARMALACRLLRPGWHAARRHHVASHLAHPVRTRLEPALLQPTGSGARRRPVLGTLNPAQHTPCPVAGQPAVSGVAAVPIHRRVASSGSSPWGRADNPHPPPLPSQARDQVPSYLRGTRVRSILLRQCPLNSCRRSSA